tara:strand:+ start:372 stop:635 length:264 start_codon:yes stop_codon:yes gene_type:complete
MGRPPEAFMIFREELRKAQLEKDRLKEEYEQKVEHFSKEMSILREQLSAQENMMKSAFEYVTKLEDELENFKKKVDGDNEKNSFGYH